MIKVETITLKEFRGIRSLTLDLKASNFAVCGPNGTGKSGIVDGLEFGLTGSISRLSGKGRGALSIKEHGPHVDSRSTPEKAEVTIDIVIPSLGNKRAQIVRSVKNPSNPKITPADPDVLAVLKRVGEHPEFVLSRREIIKYVLAEPSERSKEIQALLQLDELETTRATLLKIANTAERELKPVAAARTGTRDALIRGLGVSEVTSEAILAAVNEKRNILGLSPLTRLEATTSIRDGLDSTGAAAPAKLIKATAQSDTAAALEAHALLFASAATNAIAAAKTAIAKLQENGTALTSLSRDKLLDLALELFDDAQCPVCETPWQPEKFLALIAAQKEHLAAIVEARKNAERSLEPVVEAVSTARQRFDVAATYAPLLPKPIDAKQLVSFSAKLRVIETQLRAFLPLEKTIEALGIVSDPEAVSVLQAIAAAIEAIPDPTDRDAARDFLTSGQERLQAYRIETAKHARAARQADIAKRAFEIYGKETTAALEAIYQKVEQQFRDFYRAVNSDDENDFEAQLTPSIGKLGFEVNFYGRGFFPPGAYHSEGHQDAMGLCLYLALMKHLLGDAFTFAVLDDVLMSVDTGHRREVCALLKKEFPNTQFVLTTHDGVWLRHMKSVGLIKGKAGIEFRKWDVNAGPSEWKDIDVWAEIEGYVAKNDVRSAAALLRHQLEHLSGEYCTELRARVEYRGDGKYELGDLLPSAIGEMKRLLKAAKSAAQSWVKPELVKQIGEHEAAFTQLVTNALVEQWQINTAVHYNAWENFARQDFEPVVAAFKALATGFTCTQCATMIHLVKDGPNPNALRCDCGTINFSLVSK